MTLPTRLILFALSLALLLVVGCGVVAAPGGAPDPPTPAADATGVPGLGLYDWSGGGARPAGTAARTVPWQARLVAR